MLSVETLKELKKNSGYSNQQLANLSGIPLSTVQKVFAGTTKAPRRDTLEALERILKHENGILMETAATYGSDLYGYKGNYTLDDYLALPDELRVELIDGKFYDMAAPHAGHQAILGMIHAAFFSYVTEQKEFCMSFVSPIDVQLDRDDKTVVQPDVLILCDRNKLQNGRIFGAPDLVVEVLSPSTRRKDMFLKLNKYAQAGVREYWYVDPIKRQIVVYDLEAEDSIPRVYSGTDSVPVLIWGGRCKVDFGMIFDRMGFMYEM